jgi:hypothetical protein
LQREKPRSRDHLSEIRAAPQHNAAHLLIECCNYHAPTTVDCAKDAVSAAGTAKSVII